MVIVMRAKECIELVNSISDDIAALILVVGGIYMAIVKDYYQGYSLITLGVGYLFGSHYPKAKRDDGLPKGGVY